MAAERLGAEPLGRPGQQLVLAGGGHAHALVLRMWAMRPRRRPAAWITLVSRHSSALYSGMVPGLLAGIYSRQECAIDLRRLCALAGVSFVQAEICGLDPAARLLLLEGRPPLPYDLLGLDVGAVTAGVAGDDGADMAAGPGLPAPEPAPSLPLPPLPVKPLEPFLAWSEAQATAPQRLRILGGGAAAVEVALALRARGHRPQLQLRGQELHLGSRAANRSGEWLLRQAAIPIRRGEGPAPGPAAALPNPVPAVARDPASAAPEAPMAIACTGSRGPGWLAASGLPVDADGRVLTEASLQVVGQPRILASGDCGVIAGSPRPPAGVWAVRAAPVLAHNLEALLAAASSGARLLQAGSGADVRAPSRAPRPLRLRYWRPQAWALQLLGDGGAGGTPRALALWGPFALGPSRWLWRWKDAIDRRFMARLQQLPAMAGGEASGEAGAAAAMACRGCAAKLGSEPLRQALRQLGDTGSGSAAADADGRSKGRVGVGLDDAVVIGRTASGELLLQSVDGFPALVDDPWLNGRLTTLHACSDLWACGAQVESVQAVVTVPEVGAAVQSALLHQTLAGVRSVLDPLGARLLGGHTLEARDSCTPLAGLALSLSVNGSAPAARHWPKGPLRSGDILLLSRPIGTGVLFAAAMAGAAPAAWIDAALAVMQQPQAALVELLATHGCRACTDITGFGLLGHLGEMLGGEMLGGETLGDEMLGGVRVELEAAAIPALAGSLELLEQGYASTLAPANASALALLAGPVQLQGERPAGPQDELPLELCPGLPGGRLSRAPGASPGRAALEGLLIDPQTCGPLLAALPAERAAAALEALRAAGFPAAALVGRVV